MLTDDMGTLVYYVQTNWHGSRQLPYTVATAYLVFVGAVNKTCLADEDGKVFFLQNEDVWRTLVEALAASDRLNKELKER